MRWLVIIVLGAATAGMAAVSLRANYLFGYGFGQTPEKAHVFGWANVAADLWKVSGLIIITSLWRARQKRFALSLMPIWALCFVWGLAGAVGVYAQDRTSLIGGREAVAATCKDAEREVTDIDTTLDGLPTRRSVSQVDAAIAAVLARPVMSGERVRGSVGKLSANCTKEDKATAEICLEVAGLREERAAAEQRALACRRWAARQLETFKAIVHDPHMRKPIIYVVDDQPAVRSALREMLSVLGNEVEAFGSARDFLGAFDATRPACLVADVRMPDMDGIELVRELARSSVRIPAVLMSAYADVQMAVKAIKAGAEDFIEKPGGDELTLAIERCLALSSERFAGRQSQDDLERRFRSLTPSEIKVFDLVAQGRTSQEIAATMGKSSRTVDSYRIQIMDKMRADSVAVLVRQAVRLKRMNA